MGTWTVKQEKMPATYNQSIFARHNANIKN